MAEKENSLKRPFENVQEASFVDVTTGRKFDIIDSQDVSRFYVVIHLTYFCFNFFNLLILIVFYWTRTGKLSLN